MTEATARNALSPYLIIKSAKFSQKDGEKGWFTNVIIGNDIEIRFAELESSGKVLTVGLPNVTFGPHTVYDIHNHLGVGKPYCACGPNISPAMAIKTIMSLKVLLEHPNSSDEVLEKFLALEYESYFKDSGIEIDEDGLFRKVKKEKVSETDIEQPPTPTPTPTPTSESAHASMYMNGDDEEEKIQPRQHRIQLTENENGNPKPMAKVARSRPAKIRPSINNSDPLSVGANQ